MTVIPAAYSEAEVKELKNHPDVREDSEESEKAS